MNYKIYPNDIALYTSSDNEQIWTFKKLNEASDNIALSYINLGAKKGDRIASLLPNCPEIFVHYIACLKVGLVLVPMNYRYTQSEIDHALKLSGATLVVSHIDRKEDLKLTTVQPTLGTIYVGGEGGGSFETLMKNNNH